MGFRNRSLRALILINIQARLYDSNSRFYRQSASLAADGSALDVRNLPPFGVMTDRRVYPWMLHNEPILAD